MGCIKRGRRLRKANRVVVVEGEFDVLSSVQAHVPETVAIKGSALTKEQALLIKRLAGNGDFGFGCGCGRARSDDASDCSGGTNGNNFEGGGGDGGKDPDEVAKVRPQEHGGRW